MYKSLYNSHGAIIWYESGVAWLNSRWVGLLKRVFFVLECGFAEFFRGGVWLGAMLLHRHGAIVWYAFGVAWLNSRGVGLL